MELVVVCRFPCPLSLTLWIVAVVEVVIAFVVEEVVVQVEGEVVQVEEVVL